MATSSCGTAGPGRRPEPTTRRPRSQAGELHFDLVGEKLAGRFVLVRTRSDARGREQWLLLHKHDDARRARVEPRGPPQVGQERPDERRGPRRARRPVAQRPAGGRGRGARGPPGGRWPRRAASRHGLAVPAAARRGSVRRRAGPARPAARGRSVAGRRAPRPVGRARRRGRPPGGAGPADRPRPRPVPRGGRAAPRALPRRARGHDPPVPERARGSRRGRRRPGGGRTALGRARPDRRLARRRRRRRRRRRTAACSTASPPWRGWRVSEASSCDRRRRASPRPGHRPGS